MSKKIVLTGGGTAGHVNPNIALIPSLKENGYEIFYIGSKKGIEKKLITEIDIPYFSISTGKLRRYLSKENFSDIFRVVKGVSESKSILKKIKPDVIFSKGGFVSVPVVLAASRLKIPIIIHESDATPGLANKISFKFSKKICASFPETIKYLPEDKAVLTGTPIRTELFQGNRQRCLDACGLSSDKPVVTIMGGSIGSVGINDIVRAALPTLLNDYNIIHLCGKNNLDETLSNTEGYAQFEYVSKEMGDIFAATDIIISRSGANAIFEILALQKPNILVPLPSNASRGDQLVNAQSFADSGYSYVIQQKDLNTESLVEAISGVLENKDTFIQEMKGSRQTDSITRIISLIEDCAKN